MAAIVTGDPSPQKSIKSNQPTKKAYWNYSFRFFNQIKCFGFSGDGSKINIGWFGSLLDRLKELSNQTIDQIQENPKLQSANRYHKVDWSAKNIPIKLQDLDWIAETYRNNPSEYPMYQIDISRALGRIVGFWDENSVFNIVLLDPLHNIQPSKYNDYKVDDCRVLESDYLVVKKEAQIAHRKCQNDSCEAKKHLFENVVNNGHSNNNSVFVIHLKNELVIDAYDLMDSSSHTDFSSIFEAGIYSVLSSGYAKSKE